MTRMTETMIINVLPCRDIEPLLVVMYHKTPKTFQEALDEVYPPIDYKPVIREQKPAVKDAIGQDVVVGDVLWRDGRFYEVMLNPGWGLVAHSGYRGFTVKNSQAIRCPRPGEIMPCFGAWSEMLYAMQEDGAKIDCRHLFNPTPESINYIRSPDCTWRKPHPGAELNDMVHRGPPARIEPIPNAIGTPAFVNLSTDAQSECVGY